MIPQSIAQRARRGLSMYREFGDRIALSYDGKTKTYRLIGSKGDEYSISLEGESETCRLVVDADRGLYETCPDLAFNDVLTCKHIYACRFVSAKPPGYTKCQGCARIVDLLDARVVESRDHLTFPLGTPLCSDCASGYGTL